MALVTILQTNWVLQEEGDEGWMGQPWLSALCVHENV